MTRNLTSTKLHSDLDLTGIPDSCGRSCSSISHGLNHLLSDLDRKGWYE